MSESNIHLALAAASHVGLVRANNQDSGYAGQNFVVVADGMGGHAGGDVASATTVLNLMPIDKDYGEHIDTVLPDEIQNANAYLSQTVAEHPQLKGMGTTVTAGLISGNRMHLAHIGDSRAYRLKGEEFTQITKDHTFVQRLVDEGKLAPEDVEHHPQKNVILRVLGDVSATPELDLTDYTLTSGERWLFCSDGLPAVVHNNEIEDKLRNIENLQDAVNSLIELTLQGGSPDNVTIVAFEVKEEAPKAEHRFLIGAAAEVDRLEILANTPLAERSHKFLETGEVTEAPTLESEAPTQQTKQVPPADPKAKTSETKSEAVSEDSNTAATDTEIKAPEVKASGTTPKVSPDKPSASKKLSTKFQILIFSLLTVLLLAAATIIGLQHTSKNHYYVGVNNANVAIYQGYTRNIGPVKLSKVYETSDIEVANLNEYAEQQVQDKIQANNLDDAKRIVTNLHSPDLQKQCATTVKGKKPPSCKPTPTGSPSPVHNTNEDK
ncbi:MAG: protein phosphatase 2C domain-containing protein [Micrococcaceae bacterium]